MPVLEPLGDGKKELQHQYLQVGKEGGRKEGREDRRMSQKRLWCSRLIGFPSRLSDYHQWRGLLLCLLLFVVLLLFLLYLLLFLLLLLLLLLPHHPPDPSRSPSLRQAHGALPAGGPV